MTNAHGPGQVGCFFALSSPGPGVGGATAGGAIAIVQVWGAPDEVDGVLARAGCGGVGVGEHRVRGVRRAAGGVADEVVVARWSRGSASMMPHAGAAVVAEVLAALEHAGARAAPGEIDLRALYPEARSLLEARLQWALATAASRAAPAVLLGQVEAWCRRVGEGPDSPRLDEAVERWLDGQHDEVKLVRARSAALGLLARPEERAAVVAVVGRPGVGKSTLLNALAGRGVSLVSATPGTTRDHIGVTLDLNGLTARWLDLPGLGLAGAGEVDERAVELGLLAARCAEVVVEAGDAASGFAALPPGLEGAPRVRVALRADLGEARAGDGGVPAARVAVRVGVEGAVEATQGLEAVVAAVRGVLVPPEVEAWGQAEAWVFWDGGGAGGGGASNGGRGA